MCHRSALPLVIPLLPVWTLPMVWFALVVVKVWNVILNLWDLVIKIRKKMFEIRKKKVMVEIGILGVFIEVSKHCSTWKGSQRALMLRLQQQIFCWRRKVQVLVIIDDDSDKNNLGDSFGVAMRSLAIRRRVEYYPTRGRLRWHEKFECVASWLMYCQFRVGEININLLLEFLEHQHRVEELIGSTYQRLIQVFRTEGLS